MSVRTEAVEAGAFTKFRLLMWKNFLQQWRHRIQTLIEVLLPVVTMSLILLLRWQVEPTQMDTLKYPSLPVHTLQFSTTILFAMNLTQLSLAYSPDSPELQRVIVDGVTNMLIKNVKDLWPPLDELPLPPDFEIPPDIDINMNTTQIIEFIKLRVRQSVHPYNNSQALRGIYMDEESIRKVIAAVEFDDSLYGATVLPEDVSYALRFPERPRANSFFSTGGRSWRTELIFPSFEVTGPRFPYSWEGGNDPGYVNEMFIALQNAISMELISTKLGENLSDFDVHIHRYPHPSYISDMAVEALQLILPFFITVCYSYTVVNIVRAVTVEKELQLKETMKIMGLQTWLHWSAWFCKQFIYLFISAVLLVIVMKVNWFTTEAGYSDYSVFTNTPWTVLLFFILVYLACAIFFCFMTSGFFSSASTAALCTGVLWFITGLPATLLSMEAEVSVLLQILSCLSINSAMTYGFAMLLARESTGGMQWGDFFSLPSTETTRFAFGHVVVMLLVDSVLYMLIALYMEQVNPGPYGTPRSWYFIFQRNFWCPIRSKYSGDVLYNNSGNNEILMEKDPVGHAVGVQMSNLTKIFGSNIAVNNLTLNIYEDQITVLLGHNGAGKSTTISMLTGNLEVSHGSVIVAGYDMSEQSKFARGHIGLCPQHNVLFNELTVEEHLEFFARLKGFKGKQLKEDIDSLIKKLELEDKRTCQSYSLSGGQKRRLCVGIALSGAARVVLLDEPTSGMDPASRRGLWDLLQMEKKGRSLILTTHFMDEADFLGDRVAIMAQGRLQCVGSPNFLKQNHGVAYSLVIGKGDDFNYEECTALINKYIPGITVNDDRGSEMTYNLLNEHSHIFETMLNDLEANVGTIKYTNYGLIATTLEDVFMSLGADLAPVNSMSEDGTATIMDETIDGDSMEHLNNITGTVEVHGWRLIMHHMLAVWMKLGLVWVRSWGLLILQLAVPIIIINLTLGVTHYVMSFIDGIARRNLTLTQGFVGTETLLHYNGSSLGSLGALAKAAYEKIFDEAGVSTMALTLINGTNIEDYYLHRAADPMAMRGLRHSMLTGATFGERSATAWFSNFGYHDVAASLAAVHAALLRARGSSATINVYNHPLEATYSDQRDMQTMVTLLSMQLSNGIGSSVTIVSAVFVLFYIKERVSGAKLLQKAAGLQPVVLWFSSFLFDWLWFLIISLTILISCYAFDVMGLSTGPELGRLYLVILVYGAAMLPMVYIFSLLFKGPAIGFVVVFFVNTIFGSIGPQIVESLSSPQLDTKDVADIMDSVLQIMPIYSFVTSIRLLNQVEIRIQSCLQACQALASAQPSTQCSLDYMCQLYPTVCCVPENSYFEWEPPGILRYITMMVVSFAAFWAILLIVEYRLVRRLFMWKKTPPPIPENSLDSDVADEKRHAEGIYRSSLPQYGLVAKQLSKYYGKHLAVDQISFSVSDSECFGLLGVNGAGKTTTFKMLMGDETISSGQAFVSGYSVESQLTQVYKNIGYCPQFDALFGELSGRETLRVFSLVRGLGRRGAGLRAAALASALGFTSHLDKRVDQYSGGTKRKLNTAIAFLGRTRLVFVDEPTTGVDPAAKRHVWRAVRGVTRSGRGVVLTSHSMEECEALCSRLTIMVNGRFQCIGTPQHLKNKFSEGYTLTIKMKSDVTTHSPSEVVQRVKHFVSANFREPKIMEEYQGLLTYYLPDKSLPWSKMFGTMERAKRDLNVEYYSITQTTLEQIFLQFTKYQREEPEQSSL